MEYAAYFFQQLNANLCLFSFKFDPFVVKYLLKLTQLQYSLFKKRFIYSITTNDYDSLTCDSFFPPFLLKIMFLEESSQEERLAKEFCFKPCEIRELSHQ